MTSVVMIINWDRWRWLEVEKNIVEKEERDVYWILFSTCYYTIIVKWTLMWIEREREREREWEWIDFRNNKYCKLYW